MQKVLQLSLKDFIRVFISQGAWHPIGEKMTHGTALLSL